jgi:3-demethoxyubiquinol 3-hydroxylase
VAAPSIPDLDALIVAFDRGLRTLCAPATSTRPIPGAELDEAQLSDQGKAHAAALMRVNHAGEVCAQALYQGQALTARDAQTRDFLLEAAREETDHLAWTEQRVEALGGRVSVLNPFWYAGSFLFGVASGLTGDGCNLGFLAETERQVEGHLTGHLRQLPETDLKSRAVVEQMRQDESAHARRALDRGAHELPYVVTRLMGYASRVMTRTAYRL